MQEIKFRVWDGKKIYPVSNIEWDSDGQIWVIADDGKNGIELIGDEAHLSQFTGLKDKKGWEIYEDDIVRVYDPDEKTSFVDYVCWGINDNYPAFDLKYHDYDSNALSSIISSGRETIDVIGNIHVNKKLLDI